MIKSNTIARNIPYVETDHSITKKTQEIEVNELDTEYDKSMQYGYRTKKQYPREPVSTVDSAAKEFDAKQSQVPKMHKIDDDTINEEKIRYRAGDRVLSKYYLIDQNDKLMLQGAEDIQTFVYPKKRAGFSTANAFNGYQRVGSDINYSKEISYSL
jgi:hypothetical protein